jgi:sugar transferase (PEP-CTERM system associated)
VYVAADVLNCDPDYIGYRIVTNMIRLFSVFIPASIIGLILSDFVLTYLCYAGASLFVSSVIESNSSPLDTLSIDYQFLKLAIVAASVMLGMYFQDLYARIHVNSGVLVFQQACTAIGSAVVMQGLLMYLLRDEWSIGRWVMLIGSVLTVVVVTCWRIFYSSVILKAGTQRTLFVGTSCVVQEIASHLLKQPEIGMYNLGYVDNAEQNGHLPGGKVVGKIAELASIADSLKPDLIVVGMEEPRQQMPTAEMMQLRFAGIRFEEAPITFEKTFGRVLTKQLRPSQLIFSTDIGHRRQNPFWITVYSLALALGLTVIFAPVMLMVALLVKITSRGPVLFRQTRVGLNGAIFSIYKFRSMYENAEAGTGPVWARKGDPRITPVGKWLRALRLDELPQLFNVLRGEMLLIGPRPERPEFVKKFESQIPFYRLRHSIKPGITGWAQINYKYGENLDDTIIKLEYDLYYIKNQSLSLDILILLRTLKVMLFSGLGH